MAPWQVILVVCIFFFSRLNITTLGEGNDHVNTWIWKDSNEVFSHFFQHKNYALRVNSIGSFLVGFVTECALRCLRHLSCVSFNIEEATAANRRHVTCELLPVDMYNASEKLQSSESFHHWSTVVSELHNLLFYLFLCVGMLRTRRVTLYGVESCLSCTVLVVTRDRCSNICRRVYRNRNEISWSCVGQVVLYSKDIFNFHNL